MATEKRTHWYNVVFPNGIDFPGDTAGIITPSGTTAERPSSPVNGTIRYNTSGNILEGYVNGTWENLLGTVGGVNDFTDLTDTFSDYTGRANQILRVNISETGVESVNGSTVFLPLLGGSMGVGSNITLNGGGELLGLPATPTTANAATSKIYVDGLFSAGPFLPLGGGTMTGNITFNGTQLYPYDNTISGLAATDIKAAVDEVEGRVDTLEGAGPYLELTGGIMTGNIDMSGSSEVRFVATGGGANVVSLKAPAAIAADVVWLLPNADGAAGEALTTDGIGNLSWASAGGVTNPLTADLDVGGFNFVGADGTTGGDVEIRPGTGTTGRGGDITLYGGDSTSSRGGDVVIGAGSSTSSNAGDILLYGNSSSSGDGGSITLDGGQGNKAGNTSGNILLRAGANTSGDSGFIHLYGADTDGASSTAGGNIVIAGGGSYNGTAPGGGVTIISGWNNTFNSTAGAGDITLQVGGGGGGSGTDGVVKIINGPQTDNSNAAALHFAEYSANGANYIGLKAPDVVVTDQVYTLPLVDGASGEFLSTDGSGVMSWAAAGGGASDNITDADLDTSITVEAAADEDVIRFNTGNSIADFGPLTNVVVVSSAEFSVDLGVATGGYAYGAPITLKAGDALVYGMAQADGGKIDITAGTGANGGYALGTGGAVNITGGVGGFYSTSSSSPGGAVNITGGFSTATGNGSGGAINLVGGAGGRNNTGGDISITGGIVAGAPPDNPTRRGGSVTISGGANTDYGSGGAVSITGGTATTGTGGTVTLQPGVGVSANGSINVQGPSGTTSGDIRFYDNDNSNYVSISVPAVVGSDQTWILPDAGSTSSQMMGIDLGEFANVAALPAAASYPNCWALVIAALTPTAGRVVVRSDGTNWKYIADEGATVT